MVTVIECRIYIVSRYFKRKVHLATLSWSYSFMFRIPYLYGMVQKHSGKTNATVKNSSCCILKQGYVKNLWYIEFHGLNINEI